MHKVRVLKYHCMFPLTFNVFVLLVFPRLWNFQFSLCRVLMLFTLPALVHTLFAPVNALRKKSVLRRSTDLVNFIQNPLSETDIAILSGNYLRFFTYHRWHFAVFYPIFRQWGYFKCRLGYQDFKDQICQGHDKLFRVCHSLISLENV